MENIFISGVNKGFGLSLMEYFLNNGKYVIGTYRTYSDEIEQLRKKYTNTCELHYVDLGDENTIVSMFSNLNIQRIDCLINNAATYEGVGPIFQYQDITDRVFQVNVFSHMKIVSLAIEYGLLGNGSSIINVTSFAAFKSYKLLGLYCISKAAFESYTKCLAMELRDMKIRVNSIGISAHTDLYINHALEKEKWGYSKTISRIREGEKLPPPDNAISVVSFLASEDSKYVTAQHIECNFMEIMLE
ncbi:SDR family oxidoreductase [Carnobacteriaceae bacterium zg-ZUI252]|nr:SDR family oxidoreductase [Carnobacteriaceae bacterium zg-ZUI252]MBS4770867.1 SDR family oxidoreductase [Carnobacteriaceae bacterium zg-ZUI240]